MKKIALFGGSFDPIHTDHLNIAKSCYEKLGFDEVWLIPAFLNPFKTKQNSKLKDRLAMLEIAIKDIDYIKINEYEIRNLKPTTTYETVKYLTNENLDVSFSFIIGSDQLDRLEEWNNFDELINLVNFKVFKRDENINYKIIKKYNLELFTFDNNFLSSTDIRELRNLNKQIPAINEYINNNLMYSYERIESQMKPERYKHSCNVGDMAEKLAILWGVDPHKARMAGTLHDIAKNWDIEKTNKYILKYLPHLINEPTPVLHSFAGYLHLKHDWLIKDTEILEAVFNHTVGSANMSKLDIIIFCADKISIERDYEDINEYRELCFVDLMAGFKKLLINQYETALEKHGPENIGVLLKQTLEFFVQEKED